MKTRKSAAKRFKVTATGQYVRRKCFKSHLLTRSKNAKRKRRLSQQALVASADREQVERMTPYLK
ncbi:MAG: 50S ribosomal protein L35 [Abditibacteriales bacterium]|nr:50S ribosomal protein L35 [Abditibacteriales bacterium]MDW8365189.1 50S ribosomal protein L35 [Abditibacteriales bacterium]